MGIRVAILLGLLIAGCGPIRGPIKTEKVDGSDYTVDTLFDYDGCRVYRFRDWGEYIYITRCNGTLRTNWEEKHSRNVPDSDGKGGTHTEVTYVPRQTLGVQND